MFRLLITKQKASPNSVSLAPGRKGVLQRKCACGSTASPSRECEDCGRNRLSVHRRTSNSEPWIRNTRSVPAIVHEVLATPGQGLDSATRSFMEPRFGHDFSQVRVHTDPCAAKSAQAVSALAYTFGQQIVFGAGQYTPRTRAGKHLLAHELAHILQQSDLSPSKATEGLKVAQEGDPGEVEAQQIANAVAFNQPVAPITAESNNWSSRREPSVTSEPSGHTGATNRGHPLSERTELVRRLTPSNLIQRQALDEPDRLSAEATPSLAPEPTSPAAASCTPAAGIPNTDCSAYASNSWWLPLAYVGNATCACSTTPNLPEYRCIRKFLQDRLASAPAPLKALASSKKSLESSLNPLKVLEYKNFVIENLTPVIFTDHVDAYRSCCCPSGPASFPAWIAVTTIPPLACGPIEESIKWFGSCSGTPGTW